MMIESRASDGASVVFFPSTDNCKAVRAYTRRMWRLVLPLLIFYWIVCVGCVVFLRAVFSRTHPHVRSLPPQVQHEFTYVFLMACLLIVFVLAVHGIGALWVRRQVLRRQGPTVTLSPDGLTIHPLAAQIGTMPWEELEEVRVSRFLSVTVVGIVPRDINSLGRRSGATPHHLVRMSCRMISLYGWLGSSIAPISINPDPLSVPAEELAANIREYQAAVLSRRPHPGVWPPPPATP